MNSFGGWLSAVFDATFRATGRARAADDGVSFGAGLIWGRAVGGLWPRLSPKRFNIPQTALRLQPRCRAICAALCPADQSLLRSAMSFASQPMVDIITLTARDGLV
ncbi:hypothetical protein AOQ71_34275 [Bradyrhizobium manausense]|uniref:Uncharacterized protein n=1 Tax=Bradyrhizobium manausense TaxID=989370 RepID=A0A0R3D5A1_9BRAD|nr:hypothetical protein AOQ71_34275 [Bradyrhizobium manausense]